jgi:hypothetical protein
MCNNKRAVGGSVFYAVHGEVILRRLKPGMTVLAKTISSLTD